jgi:hypothetical protein
MLQKSLPFESEYNKTASVAGGIDINAHVRHYLNRRE